MPAIYKLRRQRFVIWGSAMNSGCDIAIKQSEPIVAMRGSRLVGESKFVQGAIEPITGTIAGKNSTGSIAAVRCRREPHNEKPSRDRSEAWDWPSPVIPFAKPLYFLS